jgi:hypothetical protein
MESDVNNRFQTQAIVLVASIALGGLMLTGCSAVAVGVAAPTPIPTDDGKAAAAEGMPADTAIAATCASVTVVMTTLHNARQDLALGTITADQHLALIESAYTGYRSLTVFPESQRGLRDEFEAVVEYIEAHPDTATGARFDPTAEGYNAVWLPIAEACESNLSEVGVLATTGG